MQTNSVSFSGLWKLTGQRQSPRSKGAKAYQVNLTYYPFADEKIGETHRNIKRFNNRIVSYQNIKTNHMSAGSDALFLNKVKLGKPLPITSFEYFEDESSLLHSEIYASHGFHQYRVLDDKEEKMTKAAFF